VYKQLFWENKITWNLDLSVGCKVDGAVLVLPIIVAVLYWCQEIMLLLELFGSVCRKAVVYFDS
jgi:hypothetical protein